MYELVLSYITALAPAASAVIACIVMFARIISSVRQMTHNVSDQSAKDLEEAKDVLYEQVSVLKDEIKRVTDSNEMAQIKEQYARCMAELEEVTKENAELLAKLNQRGY